MVTYLEHSIATKIGMSELDSSLWLPKIYKSNLFSNLLSLMKTSGMVKEHMKENEDIEKGEKRSKVTFILMDEVRKQIKDSDENKLVIDYALEFINDPLIFPYNNIVDKKQHGAARDITIQDFPTRISNFLLESVATALCTYNKIDMSGNKEKQKIQNSYVNEAMRLKNTFSSGIKWFNNNDCAKWGPNMRCNIFAVMFQCIKSYLGPLSDYCMLQCFKMMNKFMEFPKLLRKMWDRVDVQPNDLLGHMLMSKRGKPGDKVASSMGQGILHILSGLYHAFGVAIATILLIKIFMLNSNIYYIRKQTSSDDVACVNFLQVKKSILTRFNCIRYMTMVDNLANRVMGYILSTEKSCAHSFISEFNSNFIIGGIAISPHLKQCAVAGAIIPEVTSVTVITTSMITAITSYMQNGGNLATCFFLLSSFYDLKQVLMLTHEKGKNSVIKKYGVHDLDLPIEVGGFFAGPPSSIFYNKRYHNYLIAKQGSDVGRRFLKNIYSPHVISLSAVIDTGSIYYDDIPDGGVRINLMKLQSDKVENMREHFILRDRMAVVAFRNRYPLLSFLPTINNRLALLNAEAIMYGPERVAAMEWRNTANNWIRCSKIFSQRYCAVLDSEFKSFSEAQDMIYELDLPDYDLENVVSFMSGTMVEIHNHYLTSAHFSINEVEFIKDYNAYTSMLLVSDNKLNLKNTVATILLNKWYLDNESNEIYPAHLIQPKYLEDDWRQIRKQFPFIKETLEETVEFFKMKGDESAPAKIIGQLIKYVKEMSTRYIKGYFRRPVGANVIHAIISTQEFGLAPFIRCPMSYTDTTYQSRVIDRKKLPLLKQIKDIISFFTLCTTSMSNNEIKKAFLTTTMGDDTLRDVLYDFNVQEVNQICSTAERDQIFSIMIINNVYLDEIAEFFNGDETIKHDFIKEQEKDELGNYLPGDYEIVVYSQRAYLSIEYVHEFDKLDYYPFIIKVEIIEGGRVNAELVPLFKEFLRIMGNDPSVKGNRLMDCQLSTLANGQCLKMVRKRLPKGNFIQSFKLTSNSSMSPCKSNEVCKKIYMSFVDIKKTGQSNIRFVTCFFDIDASAMMGITARGDIRKIRRVFFKFYNISEDINSDILVLGIDYDALLRDGFLSMSEDEVYKRLKRRFNTSESLMQYVNQRYSLLIKLTINEKVKLNYMENAARLWFKQAVQPEYVTPETDESEEDGNNEPITLLDNNIFNLTYVQEDEDTLSFESYDDEDVEDIEFDYDFDTIHSMKYVERMYTSYDKTALSIKEHIRNCIQIVIWNFFKDDTLTKICNEDNVCYRIGVFHRIYAYASDHNFENHYATMIIKQLCRVGNRFKSEDYELNFNTEDLFIINIPFREQEEVEKIERRILESVETNNMKKMISKGFLDMNTFIVTNLEPDEDIFDF